MPPAFTRCITNILRNGSHLRGLRRQPKHIQLRFASTLPPRSRLPPKPPVKPSTATGNGGTHEEASKIQEKVKHVVRKHDEEGFYRRLPLVSTLRRFTGRTPSWVRRWIWRLFFLGPPLAVLFMSFPFTIQRVQGPSMTPFFNVNSSPELPPTAPDVILVQKSQGLQLLPRFLHHPKPKLERGQIVVYYTPHDPSRLAVKRVVGLPGDRVTPLPGYPGGDDVEVIVPYNHIWVEGDANSREMSQDSNYFGPISQNMVYGYVIATFTWWGKPVFLENYEGHDYPAKHSGRIEKDVVSSAKIDPNKQYQQDQDPFHTGAAALELAMMRKHRDLLPRKMRDKAGFEKVRSIYLQAKDELAKNDADTMEVAQGLVEELEIAFECVGLNKDGTRIPTTFGEKRLEDYLARQRERERLKERAA